MLTKLRQLELECAQGFVLLMYNLLEMLGKVMEFMLPSRSAVYGNGQRLLPVRAMNPLMRMRAYRRRWTSRDLSRTGRTRHLNPPIKPSILVESVLGVSP
ncbi:MAG: hypothetical protein ACREIJ_09870 [Nitrospiraceae bacterium]